MGQEPWMEISPLLSKKIGLDTGEIVSLSMEETDEWVEPNILGDNLKK